MWCTAHHRLQARQLLLGESPIPEQDAWLTKTSLSHFPMAISSKINTMLQFSAAVRSFFQPAAVEALDIIAQAKKISDDGMALLNSLDQWEASVAPVWTLGQYHHDGHGVLPSSTPDTRSRVFREFWLRSTWCFYWATEVMACESLVEILDNMRKSSSDAELISKHLVDIEAQHLRIEQLCYFILTYMQQLAELVSYQDSPIRVSPQAYMTVKSSAYIAMTIVQRANASSSEQKEASAQMLESL